MASECTTQVDDGSDDDMVMGSLQRETARSFRVNKVDLRLSFNKLDLLQAMHDERSQEFLCSPRQRKMKSMDNDELLLSSLANDHAQSFRKTRTDDWELSRSKLDSLNLMRDERTHHFLLSSPKPSMDDIADHNRSFRGIDLEISESQFDALQTMRNERPGAFPSPRKHIGKTMSLHPSTSSTAPTMACMSSSTIPEDENDDDLLGTLKKEQVRSFRGAKSGDLDVSHSKLDALNLMRDDRRLLPPSPASRPKKSLKKNVALHPALQSTIARRSVSRTSIPEEDDDEFDLLSTLKSEQVKSFRANAHLDLSRSKLDALNLMRDERCDALGAKDPRRIFSLPQSKKNAHFSMKDPQRLSSMPK